MNIELIRVVPVMSGELRQVISDIDRIGNRLQELSIEEMRVFHHLQQGLRNKEIALRLCKSLFTVNAQVSSILKKLETKRATIYYYGLYNS